MSATTAVPPDVAAYLAAVRAALDDLPAAERDDLLAEVELSVLDAAAEGGPIAARLGPADAFAAELRAAAGLEQSAPSPTEPQFDLTLRRLQDWWASPRVEAVRRALRELAPLWWVLRAYTVVAVWAFAVDADWSARYPGVPVFGNDRAGLALLLFAATLSVACGLAGRRLVRRRGILVALNLAAAVASVPVVLYEIDRMPEQLARDRVFIQTATTPGLARDGVPVDNIYPYSRDGKLLHDVLLYDGAGAPLDVRAGSSDPDRRVVVAAGNVRLYNAFPIRYFEPGTRRVADPDAAPPVTVPSVVTQPLHSEKPKPRKSRSQKSKP